MDTKAEQVGSPPGSRELLDTAIREGSLFGILHWIGTTESKAAEDTGQFSPSNARDILIAQAADPRVIKAISQVLSTPIISADGFYTACAGLDSIVSDLPLSGLRLYRSGIEALASNTGESPPGVNLASLTSRAKAAIKFIDFPETTWAPQHKFDFMGERSLSERVHTAQQMKPHAKDLLGWLADYNWPPFPGCVKQLARFPEVTIDLIKEIIANNRDDPEWLLHILEFVQEHVPIGALWEKLEPELTSLARIKAEDEEYRELAEAAQNMLGLLNEWEEERELT